MTTVSPRLRMFAGPNGSGKSTLKTVLPPELLGIYLNPDEIEARIRRDGFLGVNEFGLTIAPETDSELLRILQQSQFLSGAGFATAAGRLKCRQGRLEFTDVAINSYFASVVADYLRQQLMKYRVSFTLETVMSSPDKVELLKQAQQQGYRTYLYFIATDDPEINISRVRNRVKQGGHSVPEDKIVSRYHRSIDLLMEAIRYTNRAYVFDNSSNNQDRTWLAEITDGRTLEIKARQVPVWFDKAVLKKISCAGPA